MLENTISKKLTLLSAASLASLIVLPGSERARQMTETSGRNISGLLKNSSPIGLLVKTFLESSRPISTKCYLTWKVRVMKSRRSIYQLAVSMPRTGEKGSLLWPTPKARDWRSGGTDPAKIEARIKKRKNRGVIDLPEAVVHRSEKRVKSGLLNPTWVEWLQGYPSGWTDLED